MVTEDIDSCGQAGGVPQAMGDHGPTPCRRPKEKVDVPKDSRDPSSSTERAGNAASVITQKQIMIVATTRFLGDSETAHPQDPGDF